MKLDRNEIAGSLGDLGTFTVFLIGTVTILGMDPGAILIFAGLFNIATGIAFNLPLAVQPMKAIGIIAISNNLSTSEIAAAGILMGAILLLISSTNLLSKLFMRIPKSVIRGIQLGLGMLFFKVGMEMIASTNPVSKSYLIAAIAFIIGFLLFENKKIPAALGIFGIGVFAMLFSTKNFPLQPSIYIPSFLIPNWNSLLVAGWALVIPQLPLTIVNSLIATTILIQDYFPKTEKANIDRIALSVGIMNLISCPFGAMPMCHGSGGLAAQYKFGARTGGSVVFLGAIKLLLGLFFASNVLFFAKSFPMSVLGVMMIFGGIELATHVRDIVKYEEAFIMLLVAGIGIMVDVAFAFIAGLAISYYWKLSIQIKNKNRKKLGAGIGKVEL